MSYSLYGSGEQDKNQAMSPAALLFGIYSISKQEVSPMPLQEETDSDKEISIQYKRADVEDRYTVAEALVFLGEIPAQTRKRVATGSYKAKKSYKCDQCDKTLAKLYGLERHKAVVHMQEKPFKCDQCDYASAWANGLIAHNVKHIEKKAYPCDQCYKSYAISRSLTRHKRMHGDDVLRCDQCGKACTAPSELEIHKRKHTGERPYKCDLCGKAFLTPSQLKTHVYTHEEKTSSI